MYDRFDDDDSSWSFALGLLVGALAGAALASLLSPRSGPQNREAVIERGLVLRDRVTEATDTVTTRVRDTATSVKTRATDQAERIGAAAEATVERVQDAANTAAATVKDAATTAAERAQTIAGTASEKVQDAANAAAATVSEVAGTVSERAHVVADTVSEGAQNVAAKVQETAGVAADRARQMTGRTTNDEFEIPAAEGVEEFEAELTDTATLASESSYDAEDVRPVAGDTLESDGDLVAEALAGQGDADLVIETLPPSAEETIDLEVGSDDALVEEAQAELASGEQFEVDVQAAPSGEESVDDTAGDEGRRPA